MTEPRVAPYGSWSSPISADMLATSGVSLGEPWLEDGQVYWLEARPSEQGRCVVMRADPWSSPTEITPAGFNVRTKVHEYGGGSYAVHRGVVFFSNFVDQRLYRQAPGARAGGPDRGDRWRAPVRRRQDHRRRGMVDRGPRTSRGGRDPRGGRERARGPADRRLGRGSRAGVGSRLLRRSTHLPRWFDAVVPRLGLAVDAVGWLRVVRGAARRRCIAARDPPCRGQGRRGVDLGTRVEPDRRPVFRERSQWVVEPGTAAGWRAPDALSYGGGVRVPAVGVRRTIDRFPRRRPHRVLVRAHGCAIAGGARSGDRRVTGSRPSALCVGARPSTRRRRVDDRVHRRRARPACPARVAGLLIEVRRGHPRERCGTGRAWLPVLAPTDRIPDRRRADRVRPLLSAGQRRSRRARWRFAPGHRHEPRRADR